MTAKNPEEPNPLTVPQGIPSLESAFTGPESLPKAPNGGANNEILIITGRSGAGRTHAANALEDLDWYVVDNIPPALLTHLAGMMTPAGEGVHRLAAVVDVRGREFFAALEKALDELRASGYPYRIVFLDADDRELVRRYEANRRPHPLQGEGTILDGLNAEQKLLQPLRDRADELIDTTHLSVHDLSRHMRDVVSGDEVRPVQITLQSFGFKHGIPLDADFVADMRFVANPYWVAELRKLTGRDPAVSEYVLSQPGVKEFGDTYADLVEQTLDGYQRELKPYVTVAIGCTGGRHRSVAMTEYMASRLREKGYTVQVAHRDVGRL